MSAISRIGLTDPAHMFNLSRPPYRRIAIGLVVLLILNNAIYISAKEVHGNTKVGCTNVLLNSAIQLGYTQRAVERFIVSQIPVVRDLHEKWQDFYAQKRFNSASVLSDDIFTKDFYQNSTNLVAYFGYYGLKLFNNTAINQAFDLYNVTRDRKQLGDTVAAEVEVQRQQVSQEIVCYNGLKALESMYQLAVSMNATYHILQNSQRFRAENSKELERIGRKLVVAENTRLQLLARLDSDPNKIIDYKSLHNKYKELDSSLGNMLVKVNAEKRVVEASNTYHGNSLIYALGNVAWTLYRAWKDPYSGAGNALKELSSTKTWQNVKNVVNTNEGATALLYTGAAIGHGGLYYFTAQELQRLDKLESEIKDSMLRLNDQVKDLESDDQLYQDRKKTRLSHKKSVQYDEL